MRARGGRSLLIHEGEGREEHESYRMSSLPRQPVRVTSSFAVVSKDVCVGGHSRM